MQHKIIIKRHRPWLKPALVGGVSMAVLLGSWALYSYTRATTVSDFEQAQTEAQKLRAERRQLSRDLRTARSKVDELEDQIAYLKQSNQIDKQACATVQKSLTDLQAEASELREQVAFYRGIAAPDQAKAGVRVQEIRFDPVPKQPGSFRLFLTLIQSVRQDKRVSGHIEMKVVGKQGGAERSLPLDTLSPDAAKNLVFSLKYFEEFSGQFQLPSGFSPERVVITLVPDRSGAPQSE